MRRIAALALAGLLSAGVMHAALPALVPTPTPSPTPTPTPTVEKEGKIQGYAQKRPQGGWIGLEIKDSNFRLTFYNDKKKPIPADRTSATLKWSVHYQPNPERTELLPTDNPAVLASAYSVRAPYLFKLHVNLFAEGLTEPETYIIDIALDSAPADAP
jgi:hypothetical protein